uniref:Uncharacterized protein n=1 Tax=Ditylenchus dipsaci TaxID=166011 RepID=A0A915CU51_9BILA
MSEQDMSWKESVKFLAKSSAPIVLFLAARLPVLIPEAVIMFGSSKKLCLVARITFTSIIVAIILLLSPSQNHWIQRFKSVFPAISAFVFAQLIACYSYNDVIYRRNANLSVDKGASDQKTQEPSGSELIGRRNLLKNYVVIVTFLLNELDEYHFANKILFEFFAF